MCYVLLCLFAFQVSFTIYSLSIETMYPPAAQEFYTTSSDNKNKIEDDKFSMDSDDNFPSANNQRQFVSLNCVSLRLCNWS